MVTMNRNEALAAIRRRLLDFVDEDHSMCQVAGERGIMCHGFSRLTEEQLRKRYSWLLKINPSMRRTELEHLANKWEVARQAVQHVPISCDAQALEKDTCEGWDGFDDETIARFYKELIGQEIRVGPLPC
jgi:hypothetical protein